MFKREFNDSQLADYLYGEKVIDDYLSIESPPITEYWRGGKLICVIVYDNEKCTRVVYTYNTITY